MSRARKKRFVAKALLAAAVAAATLYQRGYVDGPHSGVFVAPSPGISALRKSHHCSAQAQASGITAALRQQSSWPKLAGICLSVACLSFTSSRKSSKTDTLLVAGGELDILQNSRQESPVIMRYGYLKSGRRPRLGVPGRTCMLTGKIYRVKTWRTFNDKKIKKRCKPHLKWKRLWWAKEQKFVRLRVCVKAIKMTDFVGVEEMANRAGLDLYAWCKYHWDPSSRQPLALKVARRDMGKRDRKHWPDYEPLLNQGRPLAEVMAEPDRPKKPRSKFGHNLLRRFLRQNREKDKPAKAARQLDMSQILNK